MPVSSISSKKCSNKNCINPNKDKDGFLKLVEFHKKAKGLKSKCCICLSKRKVPIWLELKGKRFCFNKKCKNINKDKHGQLSKKQFYKSKLGRGGLLAQCKQCIIEKIRKYNKKNSLKKKIYLKIYSKIYNKKHQSVLKKAARLKRQTLKYKKYRKKYGKKWRKQNVQRLSRIAKKYYQKNKNRIAQKNKKRRKTDIQYRLKCNLRRRLTVTLQRYLIKNKVSAVKNLGCSIADFKEYIEFKWEPWMNWDNYGNKKGQWSLDHIKALANFDLRKKSEQKKACHYTNYSPLLHLDNIRKSNKF